MQILKIHPKQNLDFKLLKGFINKCGKFFLQLLGEKIFLLISMAGGVYFLTFIEKKLFDASDSASLSIAAENKSSKWLLQVLQGILAEAVAKSKYSFWHVTRWQEPFNRENTPML